MPIPLAGPGQGLPFPQNLYPSELVNSPQDSSSNRLALAPGDSFVLPAGDWLVTMGMYCVIQYLDPVTGIWTFSSGSAYNRGTLFVTSDGFNIRVANLTGCPVGAVVVAYGSGWVQGSTTITVTGGGGATFLPIVGGQLSIASITAAGAGYGVPPIIYIPPPPPAQTNANGVGGIQAHAYASITSGTISQGGPGISFTNPGAGYPSAPKAVIVPSPFDPNLSTGITAATVTFSVVGAGSITGVLCTNNGAALANPANYTLAPSGVGSNATLAPVFMQTCTLASVTGGGTGFGTTAALISSVGGAPSVGTITNSPEFLHLAWIPRPLQAQATITGTGTIAAQAATIIDGGLFLNAPTPLVVAGMQSGAAGSQAGPTITFGMGGTVDFVQIQAGP